MTPGLFIVAAALAAPIPAATGFPDRGPAPPEAGSLPDPTPRDTLEGIERAIRLIRHHYRGAGSSASARGSRATGNLDRYCSGGEGSICHGGDPDRGECNADAPCHPSPELLVDGLLEEARAYPASGFLMGQAVYAATKFGRIQEAQDAVELCRAEAWWCEALRGYVLYAYAPLVTVEARFRSALEKAPSEVRCRWGDAMWLLGAWDQRVATPELLPPGRVATADWDCATRLAASDTLWWWADPLLGADGNDRWTAHVARAVAGELHEDLMEARRGSPLYERDREYYWAMRIRRGPWDSYERLPGRSTVRLWTSDEAARYHFIPDVSPGALSDPTWRLRGDLRDEGYTPEYGPLVPVPVQTARFRAGDRLRVAAAGDLQRSPRLRRVVEATSTFVLTDRPGSFPLQVARDTRRERPVLVGEAPPRAYLAAFEVETELGIGVDRRLLSPLVTEGPEISDLLLYDPSTAPGTDSLGAVLPSMLGSNRLEEGAEVGVFWEVYDAPEGESLTFELTLEREAGGLVDRLVGLFPGGAQEGRGRVGWTEAAQGDLHPRGITLDLSDLRSGVYVLSLSVRWPEQPLLERRRELTVE